MIYRFSIVSDEVDDFRREIQADPEATFLDLHKAIQESVGYDDKQLASFFICNDEWEKCEEITLEEMDSSSEMDSWVMEDTQIDELVDEEKQKLIYVFDYMTDRCFFIELSEIITGKSMTGAKCTKKRGDAPQQVMDFDELEKKTTGGNEDFGIDFYGDEGFNEDEFDKDGFESDGDLGSDFLDSTDIY